MDNNVSDGIGSIAEFRRIVNGANREGGISVNGSAITIRDGEGDVDVSEEVRFRLPSPGGVSCVLSQEAIGDRDGLNGEP